MKKLETYFSHLAKMEPVQKAFPQFQPRLQVKAKAELPALLKQAWDLAVYEVEANIQTSPYGGEYFTAGGRGGWHGMLFGQDTVGTALLSLNQLYPDVMRRHIRSYVLARLNVGFLCPDGWLLENCEKAIPVGMNVWQPDSREFCNRYHMSPVLNRTGMDAGWLWAAGDLFDRSGADKLDWAWLFGMGNLFFEHFYKPFYDEKDGLYFGQASFIDVGGNGYPLSFGERATQKSRNAAVWIKSASCNALYVRSMDVMAYAASVLGRQEDALRWQKRADELRKAICQKLRFSDGTFTYFMHRDGKLEERREALGAAFCILAEVVTGEEAKRALAEPHLSRNGLGVSLFAPFYEENPLVYHNKSAWPFASTFYYLAWEKAMGKSALEEDAAQLAHAIVIPERLKTNDTGTLEDYRTGSFMEYVRWEDGIPSGTCAQTWTVSAFLNFALRAGLTQEPRTQSRFF